MLKAVTIFGLLLSLNVFAEVKEEWQKPHVIPEYDYGILRKTFAVNSGDKKSAVTLLVRPYTLSSESINNNYLKLYLSVLVNPARGEYQNVDSGLVISSGESKNKLPNTIEKCFYFKGLDGKGAYLLPGIDRSLRKVYFFSVEISPNDKNWDERVLKDKKERALNSYCEKLQVDDDDHFKVLQAVVPELVIHAELSY